MPEVSEEEMKFMVKQEPFSEYTLEDGTQVKVKLVMIRALAQIGQFYPNGAPVVNFNFQQVIDVKWPPHVLKEMEERRKKAGQS